jgi:hypothetical protein
MDFELLWQELLVQMDDGRLGATGCRLCGSMLVDPEGRVIHRPYCALQLVEDWLVRAGKLPAR